MLSQIKKSIMIKAVQYRLESGEELEEIMNSYTKLTEDDKKEIISEVNNL